MTSRRAWLKMSDGMWRQRNRELEQGNEQLATQWAQAAIRAATIANIAYYAAQRGKETQ